jgi:hypothetical protein
MLPFFEYLTAGLSVIPVKTDKRPTIATWAPFQKRMPTGAEVTAWGDSEGIAIIAGAISGNLVCVDVDTKHDSQGTIFLELSALLAEWGCGDLIGKCVLEQTPSGGWHILFRSPFVVGCEKLCRDKGKPEAMIETKGEGGYFVCAPTPGWELRHGSLTEIPTLSGDEANAILGACWALDRNEIENDIPSPPTESRYKPGNGPTSQDITVLDDFSARVTFESLEAILSDGGWRRVGVRGRNVHLCRPGKGGRNTSATLHMDKMVFYVHSTSTEFQEKKGYGPAGVYAMLKHGGDFKAATKDLAGQGYGTKREYLKPTGTGTAIRPNEPREKLLLNMNDLDKEIMEAFDTGADTGIPTEWPNFKFQVASNQMTVVTGWPSSGKSTFIQSIAVHLAKDHGWHFVIASMEDYPNRRLGGKLIRKYIRKPTYGNSAMTREEYGQGWEWVKEHFTFVNAAAENITASNILAECTEANKVKKIHGLILDPWSEMDEDRPSTSTETDFIKISLKEIRKFSRAHDIHTFILAHPTKPQRGKSGHYHELNLYDIAGSHHWRAKADNGLIVRRDFESNITTVEIPKIKFADYGKMNTEASFKFDAATECYYPVSDGEIFTQGTDYKAKQAGDDDELF